MLAETRLRTSAACSGSPEALRERIAILEEENRQLRALLKPRIVLPRQWRLTQQQSDLLNATRAAAPGVLTWGRASAALHGLYPEVGVDVLRNAVAYQIRRRLRAAGVPVVLDTVQGVGLMLSPESVAAFDRLTGRTAP